MEEKSIIIWKDGTSKVVDSKSAWEFEADTDYLTTIKMQLTSIIWQSAELGSAEGILVNILPEEFEELKDSAKAMFEPCQITEV